MRLIRGAAPGASLHENWAYMRDHARAATPSEAKAFADALAPMPPSKAHRKRLGRIRDKVYNSEPRQAVPDDPRCLFIRQQTGKLSQLLGSPGWQEPEPLPRVEKGEPGVARPLTADQLNKRAAQRFAEKVRLAGYGCMGKDDGAIRAFRY